MPNRIIKESAFLSDKIAELSDFEFRLWVGLITQADDLGRGDARPAIIKGRVFALRERTAQKDIEAALRNLAAVGCVSLYTVGGKPYYQFPNWAKHQRVRNSESKYPGIEESDISDDNPPQVAASRRNPPLSCAGAESNPIQSNPNPNISTTTQSAAVLTMPLIDKTEFEITQKDVDEWQDAYPGVDVMQQLRQMRSWCKANPKNMKTRNGVRRFINGWLAKEQDRGGGRSRQQDRPPTVAPPPDAAKREKAPDYLPEWSEGGFS